jgi:hypothetical protein
LHVHTIKKCARVELKCFSGIQNVS